LSAFSVVRVYKDKLVQMTAFEVLPTCYSYLVAYLITSLEKFVA